MLSLRPGDVFYDCDQRTRLYYLFKVIRSGDAGKLFVAAWWPESDLPTVDNRAAFSVRTDCEELDPATLQEPIVIAHESVTTRETEAFDNFSRIRDGLRKRVQEPAFLLEQARQRMAENAWEEAADLFTLAAPFAKFDADLFYQRGCCYLQLECYSEAIADLEHSLDLRPDHPETLYQCALTAIRYRKPEKAREKLKRLIALEPGNDAARELLKELFPPLKGAKEEDNPV